MTSTSITTNTALTSLALSAPTQEKWEKQILGAAVYLETKFDANETGHLLAQTCVLIHRGVSSLDNKAQVQSCVTEISTNLAILTIELNHGHWSKVANCGKHENGTRRNWIDDVLLNIAEIAQKLRLHEAGLSSAHFEYPVGWLSSALLDTNYNC